MCYFYTLRRSRDEAAAFARYLSHQNELALTEPLPDFGPRWRFGPRSRGLILRLTEEGRLTGATPQWGLIPPGARTPPRHLMANARSDKLTTAWPWKMISRANRCLVLADGFFEPEKPSRAKGKAPWSYYSLREGSLFVMAGLHAEATDQDTGEVLETYTVVTTDACEAIRVHDRMPVIVGPDRAGEWLAEGDVPVDLLRPYPAADMRGWRVPDEAKDMRAPDNPRMIEAIDS